MRIKKRQIKFYCTDEEFKKINSSAARFNLATGTYMRLLGIAGLNPMATQWQGETRNGYPVLRGNEKSQPQDRLDKPRLRISSNEE